MAKVISIASELRRANSNIGGSGMQGLEDALNAMVQEQLDAAEARVTQAQADVIEAKRCEQDALARLDASESKRREIESKLGPEREARMKAEEMCAQECRAKIELQGLLSIEQKSRQAVEERLVRVTQERDAAERKAKEALIAERKPLQTVLPKAEIKPPSYSVTVARDGDHRIKELFLTPK